MKFDESQVDSAKSDIVGVIERYVPLKKTGIEYEACCPFHTEKSPSFKVNPEKRIYHCFGCGAHGDAVDFVMQKQNISFLKAVEEILGLMPATVQVPVPKKQDEWTALSFAPSDNQPKFKHAKFGTPSKTWAWRNRDGQLVGFTARFNHDNGSKDILPMSWCVNNETGEAAWKWKAFPAPRCLLGEDELSARPSAPVLVVEGEKTRDAAKLVFSDHVVITWPGGSNAISKANWSILDGRRCRLWPDWDLKNDKETGKRLHVFDQPGMKAMMAISKHLGKNVTIIPPMDGAPDGWDLADEYPYPGFNPVQYALQNEVDAGRYFAPCADEKFPTDPDEAVGILNKSHALVLVGGDVAILRDSVNDEGISEVKMIGLGAFKTLYANRIVRFIETNTKGELVDKWKPLAESWIKHADRRTYEGVTFSPSFSCPRNYYNLWRGFSVEPLPVGIQKAARGCSRFLRHLKYIICNGNREHFRYLLAWIADMLQDPDEKKGVALVLRGLKGTGKSKMAEVLSSLLGRHAIKISQMRHLLGNFNRHLADKLLITVEESFWAGSKQDEGPLKDMITSKKIVIESKGIDSVETKSIFRIIMNTNNDWVVPVTQDERRYFVLDVAGTRKGDFTYFAGIDDQLYSRGNYGLRCLLTFLQKISLDGFNLRQVPDTVELRRQRNLSLDPHDQYLYDALSSRALMKIEWNDGGYITKADIYRDYLDSCRMRGKTHLLTDSQFAKKLIQIGFVATRQRNGIDRIQAWRIPAWDDSVSKFSEVHGVDIEVLDCEDDDNDSPF